MKNFLSIMAATLVFSACSKDDSTDSTGTVLGKWNFNQISTTLNGELVVGKYPGNEEGCPKDFLNFKENGTLEETDFIKQNSACQSQLKQGTYSINNNLISIGIDGEIFDGQITKLTNTDMIIKGTFGNLPPITFSFKR